MNGTSGARLLVAVTAFKVLAGTLCLTFLDLSLVTGAGDGALPPGLNLITLCLFIAAAGPLLAGGQRDARAILLGATFLVVASFFLNRLLLAPGEVLEPGLLRSVVLSLHWLPTTALLPLFLWLFAREFPHIAPRPAVDRILRGGLGLSVMVAVGLTLLTLPQLLEAWSLSYQAPEWSRSFMAGAPLPKRHEPLVIPLAAMALLVMIWKRRYAEVRERRRVTLLAAGLVVGLLPIMSIVLLEHFVAPLDRWLDDPGHRRWVATFIFPALLSIPFTTAYAVLVQHALDLRFIARKALQYSLAKTSAMTLAAVPMAGLLVYLYRERTRTLQEIFSGTDAVLLTLSAVFGIAAVLNRQALLDSVDRRFFREQFDARQILTPLVERIRNAGDRRELASLVTHGVDRALHLETVRLLVEDPDRGELVDPDGRSRGLPIASTLSALVGSNPQAVPVEWDPPSRALEALGSADRQWLVDGDFRLLVPLFSLDGALSGLLALGEKKSSLPFLREDRQLLSAIANAAGLALDVERMKGGADSGETPVPGGGRRSSAGGVHRGAQECYGCGRLYLAHSRRCTHCQRDLEPAMVPYVVPGRFRFEQRIGSGGMGVVYRAVDLALSRPVAVKTMRRVSVDDAVRLRREARAAAKVVHPNLALIYGVEIWQGTPMLILEYLSGGTLEERLATAPLKPEDTLRLGIDLAGALGQLHRANILHRDLKPSNIGYGAEGSPKLMDFGIARLEYDLRFETSASSSGGGVTSGSVEGSATLATWTTMRSQGGGGGRLVGTLQYLSPEAVRREPPDPSFDLWGLCLVLYECLSGERVFRGTVGEVTEAVSQARIPPLSTVRPGAPEALEEFFRDELSLDRSRRAASADELQRALRQLRSHLYGHR